MKNPATRPRRASWDQLDRDTTETMQMARLRNFLRSVVLPYSAYYRERIDPDTVAELRTLSDLRRLPFTRKRDLLNTPQHPERTREFVIAPEESELRRRPATILRALLRGREAAAHALAHEFRPLLMTSTTGRSSDPVPFLYTGHDLDLLTTTGRRIMEIGGSRPEWRHLNLFPYAPHLAFWQTHHASLGFGTFCLSTGGGKVMGTEGNVRMLGKIRPEVLIGMPTFLYHVLQQAVEDEVELTDLRRIVLGGEKVPEGIRQKLRALAARLGSGNVDVIATYGFTEAKMAFPECPTPGREEPSGYHLYPDLGIVEVIDPETGEPVADGAPGEIVFTPLDCRGSAVLRYRTGDLIEGGIVRDACPHCGRLVPRLSGKISRVSDQRRMQLGKIKGTLVDFNELEHLLDNCRSIGQWQIELRKLHDDPMEVDELVVHAETTADPEVARREITRALREGAELSPNAIMFHTAPEMRELQGVGRLLKEEKVVDRRPTASSATSPPGAGRTVASTATPRAISTADTDTTAVPHQSTQI